MCGGRIRGFVEAAWYRSPLKVPSRKGGVSEWPFQGPVHGDPAEAPGGSTKPNNSKIVPANPGAARASRGPNQEGQSRTRPPRLTFLGVGDQGECDGRLSKSHDGPGDVRTPKDGPGACDTAPREIPGPTVECQVKVEGERGPSDVRGPVDNYLLTSRERGRRVRRSAKCHPHAGQQ